jgi:hypothetical protein
MLEKNDFYFSYSLTYKMSNWGETYDLSVLQEVHWLSAFKNCFPKFTGTPSTEQLQEFKDTVNNTISEFSGKERVAKVLSIWDISGFLPREKLEQFLEKMKQ